MSKHEMTLKHSKPVKHNAKVAKVANQPYMCDKCSKCFNDRAGLWRHNKKCVDEHNVEDPCLSDTPLLMNDTVNIMQILKIQIQQNADFKNSIIDLIKEQQTAIAELSLNPIIHNSCNNKIIHNKTFNIQVFLNEQCKDALNISEFVQSIKLQLSDLETTGRLGYVAGISNIFLNNLKQLDTHQRPIHCSDLKREVIYIKDEDQWSKEEDEITIKLQNVIKQVANKNIKQIPEWVKQHPNCTDSDSKKNTTYLNIVSNSMSGSTKEEQSKNINQIIKNLVKEVFIKK